jgi:hypothetical protein
MKSKWNIHIRKLDSSYNQKMLDIIRSSPIETNSLDLYFDKSPDFFLTTDLWSDRFQYYGIFFDNELAGFGMHLKYRGYIHAKIHEISYFGNFCIAKRYRKLGLFKQLSEYMLKELYSDTSFGFCLVLEENQPAQKYFREDKYCLPSMPAYKLIGSYETRNILITGKRRQKPGYIIRKAGKDDYKLISPLLAQEYSSRLLAPEINADIFRANLMKRPGLDINCYYLAFDNDKLVGICAAWDISSFKRTRILRYKNRFYWIRWFYNFFSEIFGYPVLPENAEALREVYVTDTVIIDRNPEVLKSLLERIYNEYREKKYNLMYFGSFRGDSLLKAVDSFNSISLQGDIYFSARDGHILKNGSVIFDKPFIDIALIG